ncbi:hypothetical protein KAT08_00330 [Candidatus Babeliales bacterium]|nr:hypothetical protein [Candidatus Babeliales bacterium]
MKKKLNILFLFFYSFCFLHFSNANVLADKNLSQFRNLIEYCESFYLDSKNSENFDLDYKLQALDCLYQYKDKFEIYLHNNKLINQEEALNINHLLLPLIKEVIRHLEAYLENRYGWKEKSHFGLILRPILYSFCFYISLIFLSKILNKNKIISDEFYKKGKIGITTSTLGLFSLWIFYNYKDEIFKFLKRFFLKDHNHFLDLNQANM